MYHHGDCRMTEEEKTDIVPAEDVDAEKEEKQIIPVLDAVSLILQNEDNSFCSLFSIFLFSVVGS